MKVLFLKDMTGVGDYGKVKDVANGYAFNFLIPQGIAVPATKDALRKFQEECAKQKRDAAKELTTAQQLASRVDGLELDMPVKVNDQGTLYAAVGTQKVAQIFNV